MINQNLNHIISLPQGDAIHILGQRTNQSYIESILNVSKCYTISECNCPELDKYQKVLENDFYIDVGLNSVIKPLANTITIPATWFRFASKSQLTELGEHPPYYPGTIIIYETGFTHRK